MVPPFLLMYAPAVVLSTYNNTCSLVLFLQKPVRQKKAACNQRKFMWHLFSMQFHLPTVSVNWSVLPQLSKHVSEVLRSKDGS